MRELQKGDTLSIGIYDWHNLISACVDNPDKPIVEINFSRLVIEGDQMKIEGAWIGIYLCFTCKSFKR